MRRVLVLLLFCALALSAADIAGTWKATMEGGEGNPVTWVFKVEGNKITGTASSEMSGEVPMTDVKLEGDNLSFTVTLNLDGQETKVLHKGTVAGNEMKLTVQFAGMDQSFQMTARKQ